jgi:DNA-directed RNA polymerase specialized sigma24 family protein
MSWRKYNDIKADLMNIRPDSFIQHGEQEFAYEELSRQLKDAIDRLPIRTRAVFVLIRNEELSYKEVGNLSIFL